MTILVRSVLCRDLRGLYRFEQGEVQQHSTERYFAVQCYDNPQF